MKTSRNIAACILGFIAIAAILSVIFPERYVPTISDKLQLYAETGDEFDVIFIGSSRTYRQLIPSIFDKAAADAGKPVRSFNMGIDGMRPPEDTYVLERALALRKKPLRLAIVECNNVRFEVREEDANTVRAIHWHDNPRMLTIAQLAMFSDQKKRGFWGRMKRRTDTFPEFWEHAGYWFQNMTEYGRGNELLNATIFGTKPKSQTVGADGFVNPPIRSLLTGRELESYNKEVDAMRAMPPRADRSDWVSQAELEKKRRLIEKAGGKMVLVVPPYPMSKRFLPENAGAFPAVVDFSDPDEYPALYEPAHRFDEGHTNRAGSEIYTRMIVERVIPHL